MADVFIDYVSYENYLIFSYCIHTRTIGYAMRVLYCVHVSINEMKSLSLVQVNPNEVYLQFYAMMTSSNGSIFRVTGHLCGNSPVTSEFPTQRPWRGALMFSLICASRNGWVSNRKAGDLKHHRAHYDVIVMPSIIIDRLIYTFANALIKY